MKYTKMLGLLVVAAAALMAFAGTASASTAKSNGALYTGAIEATNVGTSELHGSFISVACNKSLVKGNVEAHGAGVTASGKIGTLSFTECNYPVTVLKAGSLEAHAIAPTGNATLTSSGAEIKIHTSVGECIFTTTATHIGTLTGSSNTGGHAHLHISSSEIPRTGGSFFCGSKGVWTGTYTVVTPSRLDIH